MPSYTACHGSETPTPDICNPYLYSNDKWSKDTVDELEGRLRSQNVDPKKAAWLVIGSGGLPYLLRLQRHLPARIIVADLHQEVIDHTLWRVSALGSHDNWDDYYRTVAYGPHAHGTYELGEEMRRARQSGLLGSFAMTRSGFDMTEVVGQRGDIMTIAAAPASDLEAMGLELTFANLTNAAQYADLTAEYSRLQGMHNLGAALGQMPLAEEAVIVDSSSSKLPVLYSVEDYPGIRQSYPINPQ